MILYYFKKSRFKFSTLFFTNTIKFFSLINLTKLLLLMSYIKKTITKRKGSSFEASFGRSFFMGMNSMNSLKSYRPHFQSLLINCFNPTPIFCILISCIFFFSNLIFFWKVTPSMLNIVLNFFFKKTLLMLA